MKKASERIKKSITLEQIEERISTIEKNQHLNDPVFKTFIHHSVVVSDEVRLKLQDLGYKVYKGDWDGIMKDVLIIEW